MFSAFAKSKALSGKKGEEIARKYLSKKGYKILESNWRSRRGEVDLIVRKGAALTFVEVKFRKNLQFGSAGESIHPRKQQKMVAAALSYLQKKKIKNSDFRLAAMLIDERESDHSIHFFEFPLDLPLQYY